MNGYANSREDISNEHQFVELGSRKIPQLDTVLFSPTACSVLISLPFVLLALLFSAVLLVCIIFWNM